MRRVLIVHPDADVRNALEMILRTPSPRPLVVEWAPSVADGLRRARASQPHVVFLDIGGERSLVLNTVSEMRAPGRVIVGLYNPLVLRGDVSFVRAFTRAGIGDFIPLPASEADILAAVASADYTGERPPAEGQVITFFSQQGGVGTTSLAVNVAMLLAGTDQVDGAVVLCDTCLQFGAAASHIGLTVARDLADFVRDPQGGAALPACLTEEPGSGLKVLAGPRDAVAGDAITAEDLTRVLIELRRRFAWVVVDTPPVLDLLTLTVLDSSDKIFLVTEATTPTILGTERLLRILDDERLTDDRLRIVLNKFNSFEGNLSERTIFGHLKRKVNHIVPYDRNFVTASTKGRPIVSGRPAPGVEAALSDIGEAAVGTRQRRPAGAAR